MMIVKARRQGDTMILTIPANIKVPINTQFNVYQEIDGSLIYEPTTKSTYDLWSDPKLDKLDYARLQQTELTDLAYNPREMTPIGHEINRKGDSHI